MTGLTRIGYILSKIRSGDESMEINNNPILIRTYQPGDIEYIVKRHRELYEVEYGFNTKFGDYVEKYMHKFDICHDKTQENIWVAERERKVIGTIALVKVDDSTAQLRWFLIEPEIRGKGLGHTLMKTTIDFCKEKNYKHVLLWTVNILDTARHLYKSYGFNLTETQENEEWGCKLTEERWDLYL